LQHEPIAAESDDDIGLFATGIRIALAERLQTVLRFGRIRCDEMKCVCQLIPP
jgi:hypothetical protein